MNFPPRQMSLNKPWCHRLLGLVSRRRVTLAVWNDHTVKTQAHTTGAAQPATSRAPEALICVVGFEYAGCNFIRGRSRVSDSHPAARACPEAFATPDSCDGRLRARLARCELGVKARASRWLRRQSEDALWGELDSLLGGER